MTEADLQARDYRKYERLIFNLKKVYPYALMVREKLMKVNEDMKNISGERQRIHEKC